MKRYFDRPDSRCFSAAAFPRLGAAEPKGGPSLRRKSDESLARQAQIDRLLVHIL